MTDPLVVQHALDWCAEHNGDPQFRAEVHALIDMIPGQMGAVYPDPDKMYLTWKDFGVCVNVSPIYYIYFVRREDGHWHAEDGIVCFATASDLAGYVLKTWSLN